MKRNHGLNQYVNYRQDGKTTPTGRIDLNDLLERAHAEKKRDSRMNFLILSGVFGISLVVLIILSF